MIVFVTSGLWHGANWTFLIWGALHGVYQVIGKFSKGIKDKFFAIIHLSRESKLYTVLATLTTFGLATYAWMFFRANSLSDAFHITKSLIFWNFSGFSFGSMGMKKHEILFSLAWIMIWFVIELLQSKICLREWLQRRCLPIRWAVYLIIMFTCIMFGIYGELSASSFIYLQF